MRRAYTVNTFVYASIGCDKIAVSENNAFRVAGCATGVAYGCYVIRACGLTKLKFNLQFQNKTAQTEHLQLFASNFSCQFP